MWPSFTTPSSPQTYIFSQIKNQQSQKFPDSGSIPGQGTEIPQAIWRSQKKSSLLTCKLINSVQFSHSVVSDSWRPHGLQHARLPCPSPTPRAYSNSCPLSRWCHPTISSSIGPFSSHLQSFPASRSFLRCQFFASGGQSIGISASASVLPMNIQHWFPVGWISWISLQSKRLSRVFSNTTVQKHHFFSTQLSLLSNLTSIHDYWKNHSFD